MNKKYYSKKNNKSVIATVLIVSLLLLSLCTAVSGWLTKGFKEWNVEDTKVVFNDAIDSIKSKFDDIKNDNEEDNENNNGNQSINKLTSTLPITITKDNVSEFKKHTKNVQVSASETSNVTSYYITFDTLFAPMNIDSNIEVKWDSITNTYKIQDGQSFGLTSNSEILIAENCLGNNYSIMIANNAKYDESSENGIVSNESTSILVISFIGDVNLQSVLETSNIEIKVNET